MKVRIRFSKYGALRFIGHLDVMRYFQKAIRRSGIPIAYSEGFSPHQIMSFAAPLSVGHTSEGEYLDIEVVSDPGDNAPEAASQRAASQKEEKTTDSTLRELSLCSIKAALQAVMVEGISILDVKLLSAGEKNAMASVAAASYLIGFRQGTVLPQGWQEKLMSFYEQDNIPVVKKTKKSERLLNLKEGIYQLEIREDIFQGREHIFMDREDILKEGVYMLLNAGSGDNIKPAFVLECFFKTLDYELLPFTLMIHRLETYQNTGKLVPLIWEE